VYEANWQKYIDTSKRDGVMSPWYLWIADAYRQAPGPAVLDIGGGPGWDADYLEAASASVTRTDATGAFVRYQQDHGHPAIRYNILTEPIEKLGTGFDMVFAGAVLHHFDDAEASHALAQMAAALRPGGVLAFSQRRGDGQGWPAGRLGVARFYSYRQPWDLWQLTDRHATVRDMKFWSPTTQLTWDPALAGHPWLMVTAIKEKSDV
jgi:2-polyprenyl-3-methyl-5-hydroxy-6-metoxy-1,4-benzoquinol methylase